MNWQTVIDSLREDSKRLERILPTLPASAVASNATTGTAAIVLKLLADALQMGVNNRTKDAA